MMLMHLEATAGCDFVPGWRRDVQTCAIIRLCCGVGDGQGCLACCDSWGYKESDTTGRLNWTDWCRDIFGNMSIKILCEVGSQHIIWEKDLGVTPWFATATPFGNFPDTPEWTCSSHASPCNFESLTQLHHSILCNEKVEIYGRHKNTVVSGTESCNSICHRRKVHRLTEFPGRPLASVFLPSSLSCLLPSWIWWKMAPPFQSTLIFAAWTTKDQFQSLSSDEPHSSYLEDRTREEWP